MPGAPPPVNPAIRKTCKRYNDPGHAHALTFSCFQRRPFLARDRTRRWMIDAIERGRKKHSLDIWAYVLMPEHVHLLILPRQEDYNISHILRFLKLSVAMRAIRFVKEHMPEFLPQMEDARRGGASGYHFWQRRGGYDRNLLNPGYIWETIDYIHANPVRRGLCDTETDWYWSSARWYAGVLDGPIEIDFDSLPHDPRKSRGRRD